MLAPPPRSTFLTNHETPIIYDAFSYGFQLLFCCSGQLHVTKNLVNNMSPVEHRTLGIESGTSRIRGQTLTN